MLIALLATLLLATAEPYHVETLGGGVYAIVRHDPEAFANNANSLIVIGDDGVLVVDAQYTRAATNQTIGAIRTLTKLPVKYVVNTHWHDDHVAGNQVYRDSFPNVQFVMQEYTRHDLATLGAENRKGTVAVGPSYIARLQRLMDAGLGWDSSAIVPLERDALTSTIAITKQYLAEAPTFRETLATIAFRDEVTLYLGSRVVEVHWFGRGNTRGDAVVFVPDQRIVATGDLVVHPMPFAFNAYVGEWISALDSLRALHATAYVPGHGAVMRDDAYIATVQRMLTRVRDETSAAVAAGDSLSVVRRKVKLADERAILTNGDKWLGILFDTFFLGPAVSAAFSEASHKP